MGEPLGGIERFAAPVCTTARTPLHGYGTPDGSQAAYNQRESRPVAAAPTLNASRDPCVCDPTNRVVPSRMQKYVLPTNLA
jgi:hypothetical protein